LETPAVQAQVSSDAVADGRLLYIQNCSSCHGAMGEGSSVAPSLANSGPAGLDFYMRTGRMPLARLGTTGVGQTPVLSPEEIAAIIEYASAFSQGPAIPTVSTSTDLSHGWNLYVNNCAACHGVAGGGGSVGAGIAAPPLTGRDPQTIAEAMIVGPGPMPEFAFSQDDQDAIVAYVESLNTPAAPGAFPLSDGPVVEGAVAAVLGVAALVAISRWVARRDKLPEPSEEQDPHGESLNG
jgi:ubiquinol-cytochrome c reductase cytochrome c subunit